MMLSIKARVCETNDCKFGHMFKYEVRLYKDGEPTDIIDFVNNKHEVKEYARKWKTKVIEYT